MARVRADLVGAIHVGGVVLMAGDEVPPGVTLHESRLDPLDGATEVLSMQSSEPVRTVAPEPEPELVKPHHAAGIGKWRAYADHIGADYSPDDDKAAIRAAVAEVENGGA